MKNKMVVFIVIILFAIIGILAITLIINNRESNKNNVIQNTVNIEENNKIESEEEMENILKITINNKTYIANLEENETTKQFVNMLPQQFDMTELNGNEKYAYLNTTLTTNSYTPNHIEAGDIMLYGNNCLVVFYKSFNTSYSYTKIGHIENFEDLGNENITIKFEK